MRWTIESTHRLGVMLFSFGVGILVGRLYHAWLPIAALACSLAFVGSLILVIVITREGQTTRSR